jgi:glycosyltransferase domain-containing protein
MHPEANEGFLPEPRVPVEGLLTILVPTRNRPAFLARLLRFIGTLQIRHPVVIMDSSDPKNAELNAGNVERVRLNQGVDVRIHPTTQGLLEKMASALALVSTPYACFWADDDFQLPEGLEACIRELEARPSIGCCLGRMLAVRIGPDSFEGHELACPAREETAADLRLWLWSRNFYSTFYAVYRTPQLRRSLEITVAASVYEHCRMIPEILLGQLSLVLGAQGAVDVTSIVYQMHPANDSRITPRVVDHKRFPQEYARYRAAITPIVSATSGLTEAEAGRLVDRSYRNIHYWTGGRWWLLKKVADNLRRPWLRLQLCLDRYRKVPWFPKVPKRKLTDLELSRQSGSAALALELIRRFPHGIHDP